LLLDTLALEYNLVEIVFRKLFNFNVHRSEFLVESLLVLCRAMVFTREANLVELLDISYVENSEASLELFR
jgi:hypothetical protein